MINIFKIQNTEAISPEMKGHDIVLDSNHISKHTLKNDDRMGPCPHFWRHYKRSNNPYLTKKQVIQEDGWIYDPTDESSTKASDSSTTYIELDKKVDICRIENDVFAMFQHPHVSYASVIIKRAEEHPFLRADGIGNGQQIWFDLWTPYHDSLNEAERFFSAYSLLNNRQHLRKALDFVDQNLAAYYPTLFEQK